MFYSVFNRKIHEFKPEIKPLWICIICHLYIFTSLGEIVQRRDVQDIYKILVEVLGGGADLFLNVIHPLVDTLCFKL